MGSAVGESGGTESRLVVRPESSIAEEYYQLWPEFPGELYEALITLAGLRAGDHLLDVGDGAAKSTLPLARRGFAITVIEPRADRAELARSELAGFANATVVSGSLETREPPFGPGVRLAVKATAGSVTVPVLADQTVWNLLPQKAQFVWCAASLVMPPDEDTLVREIQGLYEANGQTEHFIRTFQPPEALPEQGTPLGDVEVWRFTWDIAYTASDYAALLNTVFAQSALKYQLRHRLFVQASRRLRYRDDKRLHCHWAATLHVASR